MVGRPGLSWRFFGAHRLNWRKVCCDGYFSHFFSTNQHPAVGYAGNGLHKSAPLFFLLGRDLEVTFAGFRPDQPFHPPKQGQR